MNKPNLSQLYRRLLRRCPAVTTLPDADALLALARGERPARADAMVADLANSAVHADLLQFTRALEPTSATLGSALKAAFAKPRFAASETRGFDTGWIAQIGHYLGAHRAAFGFATAMALVIAWTGYRVHLPQPQTAAVTTTTADHIFASSVDMSRIGRGSMSASDEIFRATNSSDIIFNGRFSGS